MNSETFNKNVQWNLVQVVVQVGHAEEVKARARSGYYKSAIILAAAIVEALAYKLLEQNTSLLEMPLENWQCIHSNFLSQNYKSISGNRLSICERIQPRFELTKHTDFKKVNEICLALKIFPKKFFDKIEKVRKLRNKIHIQGLENIDRSYTKRELEFISSVIDELLGKIK